MTSSLTLETPRLILRPWQDEDREPFAALNADARVMQHFPGLLEKSESDRLIEAMQEHFVEHGFGRWAVEVRGGASCIGFVGLSRPAFTTYFTPCVEVGWRLAAEHWGQGYAPEAAQAALRFGFEVVQLGEIVSFTVPANLPSRRVMEKIGMRHDPAEDFEHPGLPEGHALRHHVLYRLSREQWRQQSNNS